MASFTLDSIRAAADAKYGSTDIELGDGEVARLINPLRLKKDKRDALVKLQSQLSDTDEDNEVDQERILIESLRIVGEKSGPVDKLIDAIDGDLVILMDVFSKFSSSTELGEASASQS